MAHSQRNGGETDTIDLTFSSPEPEDQPHPREQIRAPMRQAQLSFGRPYSTSRVKQEYGHLPRIKPEPGQSSRVRTEFSQPSRVRMQPSQLAASSPGFLAPLEARPIHPSHIQSIISTASPWALQKVVMELCEVSPAFSGALVRGLAPFSTSAQDIINQGRMYNQQPHARARDDEDSDLTFEAMNIISGSGRYTQSNRFTGQSLGNYSNQARQHPYASQSIPRIKREPYRPSTPSSDSELRRPGPSQSASRPTTTRTPLQNLARDSPTFNHTSNAATETQRTVEAQKAITPGAKTCTKCHELFSNDSEPCIYHPGRKVKQEDGTIAWSCCQEDMLSVGCDFGGTHTTEGHAFEDLPIEQKRLGESSTSDYEKRQRIMALLDSSRKNLTTEQKGPSESSTSDDKSEPRFLAYMDPHAERRSLMFP
jgi:hypothetical protein